MRQKLIKLYYTLEAYTPRNSVTAALWDFLFFGIKQSWASLFAAIMLAMLILSNWFWPPDAVLARYDFLFLGALGVQALFLLLGLETLKEAKVIFLYHLTGTVMELFKTEMGSWTYPEENFFRIEGVPLFSGFMYACVGSYLARITRILNMQYTDYPPLKITFFLAAVIYINFFSHHYILDIRNFLFILVGALWGKTWVYYTPRQTTYRMPLILGFFLVTAFIWFAENIGTGVNAWIYPHQAGQWKMVSFSKAGSWFLLMIVSFVLVTVVHRPDTKKN
jgi:uncharacterized membrane protein YoaT (DUF817 family)